jgi:hypothetical protein
VADCPDNPGKAIARARRFFIVALAKFGFVTSAIGPGYLVWSKISNALKRLGFRSRNFLA